MPAASVKIGTLALGFILASAACADPYEEPLPRRDRLNYPIGLEIHPSGDFLYVVNSNFDTRYREDVGGTVSVVDLDSLEILADKSPFIPSFGGFVRLNADATRAYVTTRHSNALVQFRVSETGDALFCEVDGAFSSDPAACSVRRVPDEAGATQIPSDPFSLDVSSIDWTNEEGEDFSVDLVNLSHLRSANVTAVAFPNAAIDAATMKSAEIVSGSNVVARRPGTREIYAGAREGREIVIYFPYLAPWTAEVQAIVRRGSIDLSHVGDSADVRGITFSADGKQLYAVTRIPDALHVVDLGAADDETGSGSLRKVTTTIPLPREPAAIIAHDSAGAGQRLYIPSFATSSISVVDPSTLAVVDVIELEASPYHMVVDRGPGRCSVGTPCRAYVSLFDDLARGGGRCDEDRDAQCGSVGIIDLDPTSPSYHELIGKIH